MIRGLAAAALLVSLTACVTETSGELRPQSPPDLEEAAKINTQLGVDYARQGRFDVAEEKLRKAVEQDENYAQAHSMLAYVLTQIGDREGAEREYRRALALAPGDAATHNNFGVFLCDLGKTKEADREFQTALGDRNYPTPEAAWTNAGICQQQAKDPRAEDSFRAALKINPEYRAALAQIAALTYRKSDWQRTDAFVKRYEKLGSLTPDLLLIAARTQRKLGDKVAARRYEQTLLRDFPESDQAVQLLKNPPAP
ncbi:type IV pilus biogenesis/stability protein PilW [Nevskia sp.]|uniref:type IV pilus biogenesis/stability protein PilW n=1 Tax=Nevskia sp. TaxID=1929292 RepID=UPI0025DDCB47|nr:type IV pilus biogenesis/stability protein PilW [Nevskia sp.]